MKKSKACLKSLFFLYAMNERKLAMSAFTNGAISALERVYNLLETLDPENNDTLIKQLKTNVLLYVEFYKHMEDSRTPIEDKTWEEISKTSENDEADEIMSQIKKIFEA